MAGRWRRKLYGPCGAQTKSTGEPCRATALKPSGRCRLHGGLSTGPRTQDCKRIVADNLRRWRERQQAAAGDELARDGGFQDGEGSLSEHVR